MELNFGRWIRGVFPIHEEYFVDWNLHFFLSFRRLRQNNQDTVNVVDVIKTNGMRFVFLLLFWKISNIVLFLQIRKSCRTVNRLTPLYRTVCTLLDHIDMHRLFLCRQLFNACLLFDHRLRHVDVGILDGLCWLKLFKWLCPLDTRIVQLQC